jgi:sigma-B regulation protein RsbU (phosphoserine phosphatase)
MWSTILSGGVFEGTLVNRRKNGEFYWVEQTITPIKDAIGRITHFVSVAKDVTEQRWRREQEIQMRLARQVQQQFYPQVPRSVCGLDLAGRAYPADSTGGDYFDFVTMRDESLGVVIGDVRGHGFSSALLMAEVRAYLHAFTKTDTDVGRVLWHMNRALSADLQGDSFVTLLLARVEPRTRSLVYANAGHLSGYLLDGNGNTKLLLESKYPPLGLFPEEEYTSSGVVNLEPDDLLVLLTDGITEARSPDEREFGIESALALVNLHRHRSAAEIVQELYRAVRAHAAGQPQGDDITCVICKIAPVRNLVSGP